MDKNAWPTGIRPSGNGIRIRIWRNRKVIFTETIKGDPFNARDLASAIKRRRWLESRLILGLPVFQGDDGAQQKPFVTLAQEYLDNIDAKHSTQISYENILNRYWMPEFGARPAAEIGTPDIKRVLASLDISPKTKKNILIPLRGVLAHAEINPNPVDPIAVKRRQMAPVSRYTPQERKLLLDRLSGQEKVYFAILFGCGLRPGEALALKWSDFDGEDFDISKQITKRRLEPSTKTSVRRKVYVPTWVRQILKDHPTRFQGDHLFVNSRGGPYLDTDIFNQAWRKAHAKARIPYRIPYACRHTRAAEFLSTGIEPADAARQLGHSPEMFLRIYAEWIEEYSKYKDKTRFEGIGVDNLSPKITKTSGGKI